MSVSEQALSPQWYWTHFLCISVSGYFLFKARDTGPLLLIIKQSFFLRDMSFSLKRYGWQKLVTEGHAVWDSIWVKCPEEADPQTEGCWQGLGRGKSSECYRM